MEALDLLEVLLVLDNQLFDVLALQVEVNAVRVHLHRPEVIVTLESFLLGLARRWLCMFLFLHFDNLNKILIIFYDY